MRSIVSVYLILALGLGLRGGTIDPSRLPSSGWQGEVGMASGTSPQGTVGAIPALTPTGTPSWTVYTQYVNVVTGKDGGGNVVAAQTHLADPTGVADSQAAIQQAVTNCPNQQYVYIPTGSYYLGSSVTRGGSYSFSPNVQTPLSIAIKGDGPALTKLYYHAASANPILSFISPYPNTQAAVISSGDSRGSTSITLNGSQSSWWAQLSQGGMVMTVTRPNSTAITPYVNGGGFDTGSGSTIDCSQMVEVTGISGNTVTFSPALNEGPYVGDAVGISIGSVYRCGIQDLYLTNTSDSGADNIQVVGGDQCWVKNVESDDVSAYHVRLYSCVRCEVRECKIHDCWTAVGNRGYGADLFQYSCNNLIENNIFYNLRHAMPQEVGGQGNVFGYNYDLDPEQDTNGSSSTYLMGDTINHGGEPRWNLREGNICATIRFDDVNGGSAWNTAFRNQVQRKGFPATYLACFGTDIDQFNYYANLSGNVYENPPAAFAASAASYNSAYYNSASRRWGSDGDTQYPCGPWTITAITGNGVSPIEVTVSAPTPGTAPAFITGGLVSISGVTGNTNANYNGTYTVVDGTHITLDGTTGNGTASFGSATMMAVDPLSKSSAIIDGEYDFATSSLVWAGADHTLPNSYYLPSKPAFLGTLAWPCVVPTNPVSAGQQNNAAGYNYANGLPATNIPGAGGGPTITISGALNIQH